VLTHRPCGETMVPVQVCPHCGDAVDPHDVDARFTAQADRADD
jgi:ribosomal protein L32